MWVVKTFFAIVGFVFGLAIGAVPAQFVVTILAVLIPLPPIVILLIAGLCLLACGIFVSIACVRTQRIIFWRGYTR